MKDVIRIIGFVVGVAILSLVVATAATSLPRMADALETIAEKCGG